LSSRKLFYSCKLTKQINKEEKVVDLNPTSIIKDLEDLSQVEKYVMSEDDYQKLPSKHSRNNNLYYYFLVNFRKFKVDFIKKHPEKAKEIEKKKEEESKKINEIKESIKIGARCKLVHSGFRGTIAFVGTIKNSKKIMKFLKGKIKELGEGIFIGVKLDEPAGNSDGK